MVRKTFFENFKEAQSIIPTFMAKNPYEGSNLPHPTSANSAAWRERIAVPFKYKNWSDADETVEKKGIMYIPYYEGDKIDKYGNVKDSDIEVYGAEIEGQSLNRAGLERLVNDKFNWDFKFDIPAGRTVRNNTKGANTNKVINTVNTFQVEGSPFVRNLRGYLWGGQE